VHNQPFFYSAECAAAVGFYSQRPRSFGTLDVGRRAVSGRAAARWSLHLSGLVLVAARHQFFDYLANVSDFAL
jgi:hypothetical protein